MDAADTAPEPATPDDHDAVVDRAEGPRLLKMQLVVLSGLVALAVPGVFVLGEGSLSSFYGAALAIHLVFAGWLAMSGAEARTAALAIALPIVGAPWVAYAGKAWLGIKPFVSGPIAFMLLMVLGIAIGRALARDAA